MFSLYNRVLVLQHLWLSSFLLGRSCSARYGCRRHVLSERSRDSLPFARLICAADIVFKSNPPRRSLLSARDSATRHRRWAEVDVEGHYVSCRSLTGCMSVWPGCMMIQQACKPVRCTRVPSCGTLRALAPCCTLPTAALLEAVLAMMVDVTGSGTRLRGL